MKLLALYSIKGGVGKTAGAVHLAYCAARDGHRTLLWDLDPQGAATYTFRIETRLAGGVRRLLAGADDADPVRGSDFDGLDVLPADFGCRKLDVRLAHGAGKEQGLRGALASLAAEYDLVVLDCAPGVGALAEAVFDVADALVVPTIPTALSLRTLAQLLKHLKKRDGRRPLTLPFFSMVDARKGLHRATCAYAEALELGFLKSRIPYASAVERVAVERAPVHVLFPRSGPARAYDELADEIRTRLGAATLAESPSPRAARALLGRITASGGGA